MKSKRLRKNLRIRLEDLELDFSRKTAIIQ